MIQTIQSPYRRSKSSLATFFHVSIFSQLFFFSFLIDYSWLGNEFLKLRMRISEEGMDFFSNCFHLLNHSHVWFMWNHQKKKKVRIVGELRPLFKKLVSYKAKSTQTLPSLIRTYSGQPRLFVWVELDFCSNLLTVFKLTIPKDKMHRI